MLLALYEPEIPPNTGNIARLCAAFGVALHLIEPLGFKLENRYLKRAGLDYWPHVNMRVWPDFPSFLDAMRGRRLVMTSARDPGATLLQDFSFTHRDALLFGPETRGLPAEVLALSPFHARIPVKRMEEGGVRSLNLATSAGIILYAALLDSGLLGRDAPSECH